VDHDFYRLVSPHLVSAIQTAAFGGPADAEDAVHGMPTNSYVMGIIVEHSRQDGGLWRDSRCRYWSVTARGTM
jgi:hypothetical protein